MARRRTGEETRQLILDAAIELSAEAPPDAITTRAIAERAGVQQSLIYRHFGSRQALLDEAARHFQRTMVEHLGQSLEISESLWNGFEYVRAHPELALRVARAVAAGQHADLLSQEPEQPPRMGNLLLLQLAVHRRTSADDPVAHADLILLQCLLGGVAMLAPYFLAAPVGSPVGPDAFDDRLRRVIAALCDGVDGTGGTTEREPR